LLHEERAMKHRHVFATSGVPAAHAAMDAARAHGIRDDDLSLVARHDIELESIPDERKEVAMDFVPAALRGTVGGGAAGLLAGLVALAIPSMGVTLAGAGALAVVGAMVGTWSSALVGASIPDELHRKFEREIADGGVLVVVDGDRVLMPEAEAAIVATGARVLPYDATTVLKS
jgi:hypothetical protein